MDEVITWMDDVITWMDDVITWMDDVITWMDDVDFIVTEKESNNSWIVCRKLLPLKSTRN